MKSSTIKALDRFYGGSILNYEVSRRPGILAVCDHIDRTGDCLWHAEHVVLKTVDCHCAKCSAKTLDHSKVTA